ncbi:exopolysaccharide biosynthesis protein [uncultured Sulfitobacter sp.]|uniref:exopolysaccharide biosynthesis protein n=1 Tax=uncultured Sulfitobacter sp. TaxID=191468 RepID=UPI00260720E8|nr:exopolysaccharide biosynthesis protein [uncultured Sulfitobacter sp.]
MSDDITSAGEILDKLDALATDEDDVSVGDVVDALGGRGFGPLIFVLALLVVSPLGGIPLVPTFMALLVALIATQLVLQRDTLWLPSFLRDRKVDDDRVQNAVDKMRGPVDWLDAHTGARLSALVSGPAHTVAAAVVVGLCLLVPPSELIPFAAIVPMAAIALLGLALTVRDGVVMLLGLLCAAAALYALWGWVI